MFLVVANRGVVMTRPGLLFAPSDTTTDLSDDSPTWQFRRLCAPVANNKVYQDWRLGFLGIVIAVVLT